MERTGAPAFALAAPSREGRKPWAHSSQVTALWALESPWGWAWEQVSAKGVKRQGTGRVPKSPCATDGSHLLLSPQIFWVGPLTGAVLASLIYNFILFPDTKTVAQRLAILVGTTKVEKVVDAEPQKKESQMNSEDTEVSV